MEEGGSDARSSKSLSGDESANVKVYSAATGTLITTEDVQLKHLVGWLNDVPSRVAATMGLDDPNVLKFSVAYCPFVVNASEIGNLIHGVTQPKPDLIQLRIHAKVPQTTHWCEVCWTEDPLMPLTWCYVCKESMVYHHQQCCPQRDWSW